MNDLVQTYYPELQELTAAQLLDSRQQLEQQLRLQFPDLDMRPNSVFGDLWLTPAAQHLAALNIAQQRFKSDLNLENVAGGVIWDCEFVEKYLQNFGQVDTLVVQSYGTLRLVFNSSDPLTIDRQLVLAPPAGGTYYLRLPQDGPLYVLSPDTAWTAGRNEVRLVASEGGSWIADVGVQGEYEGPTAPTAGQAFSTTLVVPGLVSANVIADFSLGLADTRLSQLAKRTRETIYSATPSSKGGIRSFFARSFPDAVGVSALSEGDPAMARTVDNAVDVVARGRLDLPDQLVVQMVRDPAVGATGVWWAELSLPAQPIIIDSISLPGQPDFQLDPLTIRVYTQSTDPTEAPGLTACRSPAERLWVTIDDPHDGLGDSMIDFEVVGGEDLATFSVGYRQDPDFSDINNLLTSDDVHPLGLSMLVKQPPVIQIQSLTINYRRRPGTTVRLTQARAEIEQYVNTLMWPDVLSEGRIVDSLFYAGAADVQTVVPDAVVWYSVADRNANGLDPEADLATFYASPEIPAPEISLFPDLKELYTDTPGTAVGPENVRYLLAADNIIFVEV